MPLTTLVYSYVLVSSVIRNIQATPTPLRCMTLAQRDALFIWTFNFNIRPCR